MKYKVLMLYSSSIMVRQLWEKKNLEVPPIQIYSLVEPDKIARELADKIWQAFGYEDAPLFENDKFNPGE